MWSDIEINSTELNMDYIITILDMCNKHGHIQITSSDDLYMIYAETPCFDKKIQYWIKFKRESK